MRAVMLMCAGLLLGGCGGGAKLGGGKQGAAQALVQATSALSAAQQRGGSSLRNGVDFSTTVDVAGPHGGTATVAMRGSVNEGATTLESTVTYKAFNVDGKNTYDGTLKMTMSTTAGAAGATAAVDIKGKVDLSGEVSDFLDVDVKESVSVTGFGTTSGNVAVVLDGTIATRTEKHVFNKDALSVSVNATLPR